MINFKTTRQAAHILRAVNNKLRQRILIILDNFDELTVTEMYLNLNIVQSVASNHLAILRHAGLVNTRKEGSQVYYSINKKGLKDLEFISGLILESRIKNG